MSKKHKLLTILLCIALCVTLVFSLIACDKPEDTTTEVVDSGKIIANGNFELSSSTNFPKTPSSWKGAPGNSSGDNATETDAKSLLSGIINVEDKTYDKNKRTWDKVANPGKTSTVSGDDNILMIYNKKLNAYRYTSADFTLDSNKYYEVTVDVRTDGIEGTGAFVGLGGDAYRWVPIGNTNGNWIKVTFYLASSNLSSNSVNLVLANGTKGKNDSQLSKGYAFFDNALVSEVSYDDYSKVVPNDDTRIFKNDLKLSDADFENVSLTGKNPYSPNLWSGVSTSAPTGTDSLEKGIINFNESRPEYINTEIQPKGADGKALVINNKKRTAYGYRSSKKIRFETSKYYKLTINVATFIDDADLGTGSTVNAPEAGAYVMLKTGTGVDDIVQGGSIMGINTHGKWQEISILVKSDVVRNKDLFIQVGLGQGEKDDPLLVTGTALFDQMTLTAINENDYNLADETSGNLIKVSIDSGIIANKIPTANSEPNNFFERDSVAYKDSYITYKGQDITTRDTNNWDDAWGANPKTPNDSITSIIELKNNQPTANIYKFHTDHYQTILPNAYYRMGMWVKTQDILKDKGVSISLYSYDFQKKIDQPELEDKDLISKVSSFDNINTLKIKNHLTASYNDYVELAFYIEGDILKNKQLFLQISLGSGTFMESSKHVKGSAYIADISFYPVSYSDYSSAESGTYSKKYSFKSTAASVQNGDFDEINKQSTVNVYSKEDKTFEPDYSNGYLNNAFGVPQSWSSSDEAYLRSFVNAGIMNVNSSALTKKINDSFTEPAKITFDDSFFKGFEKEFGIGKITTSTNQNILAINTKPSTGDFVLTESTKPEVCGCTCEKCVTQKFCDGKTCDDDCGCAHKNYSGLIKPWGYTSPSISLSSDSYYMISVWANVVDGKASISLKTSSKDQTKKFSLEKTDGWQRYDFFVQTGFDSTSATMEMFLGDTDTPDALYSGTVFFDMPRYTVISEDEYNKAAKDLEDITSNVNYSMASYTVMTFDNVTANTDNLDTPVGWTGEHRNTEVDSEDREEKDVVSGVYNIDHGNRTLFGKGDDETRISEAELEAVFQGDNTNVLVINNNVDTEYAYSYKLSKSLEKVSYYHFSVDVYTYGLGEGNANITLKLEGTSYTFSKNDEKGVFVNTQSADGNGWKTYHFFVQTPQTLSIDNATIFLGLGDKDTNVKGYAFFDNIDIQKITSEEFPAETRPENVPSDEAYMYDQSITHRVVFTDEDVEKEEETEPEKTNPYLWLQISSGIIGGLIVIVMIYYIGKKVYNKYIKNKVRSRGAKPKSKQGYDRGRVPSNPQDKENKSKKDEKFKD